MTIINHTLGFPRVGLRRELKKAQESYWAGNATREELLAVGRELRARHWEQQKQAGVDLLPVGDFAWYDHVLTTSLLLGNVPARHQNKDGSIDIDTLFRIGRGRAPTGEPAAAAEKDGTFDFGMIVIEEFSPAEDNRAEAVEGPDSEILRRELPAKGLARQKICHHFHCPLVSVRDGNSRCGNGFPFFFQVEMEQDEIGFMPDRLAAQ